MMIGFMIIAAISLILGFISKASNTQIIFHFLTWLELAQTGLLFGIAWAIGRYYDEEL
ncbi:MAG: hypothetical protein BMS9Abin39_0782 [Ignavibacteria bacterium]|nr:MAG: hypothetical protein BMS9Abin39_0782 [Ignavibacteria bacterium]